MDRDLQILVNTPTQLTVINPPDQFNLFNAALYSGLLLLAAFLCWKLFRTSRMWLGIGIIVLVLIGGIFVRSSFRVSHKLNIDNQKNVLIYQTLTSNDIVDSKQIDLSAVKRADMDFNRTHRRIVITLKDNRQIFPLGAGFDYENSQFEVLDLIRRHIGQPLDGGGQPNQ